MCVLLHEGHDEAEYDWLHYDPFRTEIHNLAQPSSKSKMWLKYKNPDRHMDEDQPKSVTDQIRMDRVKQNYHHV